MSRVTGIKRFDDIETDSDFEIEENVAGQSVPTLSFKTEATLKASKAGQSEIDSNNSSIFFGSEHNIASESQPAPPAREEAPPARAAAPSPPAVAETKKAAPPPPVSILQTKAKSPPTMPTKKIVVNPAPQPVSMPAKRTSTHEQAALNARQPTAAPEKAPQHDDDANSDILADEVLPRQKKPFTEAPKQVLKLAEHRADPAAAAAATSISTTAAAVASSENDLLLRAKLRLEEKRRSDNTVNSSATYSPRVNTTTPLRYTASATSTPPRHVSVERQRSPRPLQQQTYPPLTSLPPRGGDGTMRRVEGENNRLQEEIQFLRQENQKLRAATSTADSAENMRIQLTVDMLRKQILEKEKDLQREQVERQSETGELRRQVEEHVDQAESYAASSAQYKSLYESKTKELEEHKKQLQSLLQDVQTIEQKQRAVEIKHREQLIVEQDKGSRTAALLEESKAQRDHLQQLNDQMQKEAVDLSEERRQLREEIQTSKEYLLKVEAAHRRAMETLQSDVEKLQKQVSEKERVHAAQLRDQQRVQDNLQKRLDDQAREADRELAHLRALMDKLREEGIKVADNEKRMRLGAEDKLREALSDFKMELRQQQEALQEDHEKRIKRAREDLRREREAKEELALIYESTCEELRQCADSLSYYQSECQSLSAAITESESLREETSAKCNELSSALEELMLHDDMSSAANRELQVALNAAQDELSTIRLRCGSTDSVIADMQRLTNENERLTNECVRLKEAREALTEENGLIANELLRWKNEMRDLLSAQMSTSSTPRLLRK